MNRSTTPPVSGLASSLREAVDLARREIEIFHDEMEALRNIAPQHYVGVVETMPRHVAIETSMPFSFRVGTSGKVPSQMTRPSTQSMM